MPVDIFPRMDIPVVSVVWTYAGMSAQDMQNRILTLHERQLASLVDDIARIEATSYEGVGVEKIYLHEGADVTRAVAQLASSSLVVLKYMPPNITPPLILRYGATDVPIIQLSLSSDSLPDTALNDLGQNIIRPDSRRGARRRGALSLWRQAARHHGRSRSAGAAVARSVAGGRERRAAAAERHPAGGRREDRQPRTTSLAMNNSPDAIEAHQRISDQGGQRPHGVHARRGACTRRLSGADQLGDGRTACPGALMTIRKTGGVSTLAVIDGISDGAAGNPRTCCPQGVTIMALFDQSIFVKAALEQRADGRRDGGGPDRPDDPAVSGQLAPDADHPRLRFRSRSSAPCWCMYCGR